jgi:hypothetical protein
VEGLGRGANGLTLMNRGIPFGWLFLLVLFLVLSTPIVSSLRTAQLAAKRAVAGLETANLLAAITNYANTYGSLPQGKVAAIFASLNGENSNKIVFLSLGATRVNTAGEFVDPWRTPFRILITNQNVVVISSAGQNRSFGDGDDLSLTQRWQSTSTPSSLPTSSK